jgi:hypothetical protein
MHENKRNITTALKDMLPRVMTCSASWTADTAGSIISTQNVEQERKKCGRAMAQAVSRWPLTAEARVRARVNPCGICGGQSGTGQVFSKYFGFPLQIYHSTIAPYSSITAP